MDIKYDFANKFMTYSNNCKALKEDWYTLKIPELNSFYSNFIIDKLKFLVDGMNLANLIPVVFKIKPPHVLSYRMSDSD